MSVDQDRRGTARDRRAAIISKMKWGFDRSDPNSPVSEFVRLAAAETPRSLVINADIDGLVSAQMLSASTGWRVGALIERSGTIRVHSDYASPEDLVDSGSAFGVDVFSPLFPSISNHPVYFGSKTRSPAWLRARLDAFDQDIADAVALQKSLNPSAWVGISAARGSDEPTGMPYKYPLGTAQLLLAVLETAGLDPKIFDRQYLPWLIANCDGGVDTIRTYAWNAESWWSALAAVVGPASHSEALYRMVTSQRPNEFIDADRRLRYEEADRSAFLNTKWNLAGDLDESLREVSSLLTDLSGWGDPFADGAGSVETWATFDTSRNLLPVRGLTKAEESTVLTHLEAARSAIHMNFSTFKERGVGLGWSLPRVDSATDKVLGKIDLDEDIPGDEPTVPAAEEQ